MKIQSIIFQEILKTVRITPDIKKMRELDVKLNKLAKDDSSLNSDVFDALIEANQAVAEVAAKFFGCQRADLLKETAKKTVDACKEFYEWVKKEYPEIKLETNEDFSYVLYHLETNVLKASNDAKTEELYKRYKEMKNTEANAILNCKNEKICHIDFSEMNFICYCDEHERQN